MKKSRIIMNIALILIMAVVTVWTAEAAEVTGSLSSGVAATGGTIGGSVSGGSSVSGTISGGTGGGSTVSGTVTGGGSGSGGGGSSSGSNSGGGGGSVLGASTGPTTSPGQVLGASTTPGFPATALGLNLLSATNIALLLLLLGTVVSYGFYRRAKNA